MRYVMFRFASPLSGDDPMFRAVALTRDPLGAPGRRCAVSPLTRAAGGRWDFVGWLGSSRDERSAWPDRCPDVRTSRSKGPAVIHPLVSSNLRAVRHGLGTGGVLWV